MPFASASGQKASTQETAPAICNRERPQFGLRQSLKAITAKLPKWLELALLSRSMLQCTSQRPWSGYSRVVIFVIRTNRGTTEAQVRQKVVDNLMSTGEEHRVVQHCGRMNHRKPTVTHD